jgi:tetratricopeptide (TPR) repeat protein
MANVASLSRVLTEDAEAARARQAEYRAVIDDIVAHAGGRVVPLGDDALVAEFQSAVEAVRAALDAQETLRVRNKELTLAQRLDFKLGITIGEVTYGGADGVGDVSPEALHSAAHLVSLAAPGGVCISRTVREAVASKLKGQPQDLTVEGEPFAAETSFAPHPLGYGAATESAPARTRSPSALAALAQRPTAVAGVAATLALVALAVSRYPGQETTPKLADEVRMTAIAPAAHEGASPGQPPLPKSKVPLAGGGTLEFMPAHAPDPTAVLSAARMLPQAWKNCREASADTAVTACKTLIDSGLAKGDELAEIQTLNGRALRDRHELDKALEALTASIALNPTPAAYSLRGTVYYDKGSWEQAISDYSEAIRLDATNGEAFNNRAWTYYRTGRSEKALTDADAAVRLLGKQSYVWDTRGHIHAALGNREAAISDFRAALAIDPNSADSQAGLSKLGVN